MSGVIERMRERENAEAKFAYHIRREVGERVLEQMSICIFNSRPAERGLGDVSWTLAYCVVNLSECAESLCAREGGAGNEDNSQPVSFLCVSIGSPDRLLWRAMAYL